MNAILGHGVVTPIMDFQFADGNHIDTYPTPRYFLSFNQKRSVKKACSFSLTITYPPGNFGDSEAILMHQLLLTNSNKPVQYRYGYATPGGSVVWQNQSYVGIFTKYVENLSSGYLQYTITGIAQAVECTSPETNITSYLTKLINDGGIKKPSDILKDLINGVNLEDRTIPEFFRDYRTEIDGTDLSLEVRSYDTLPKGNTTIHDVIFGKTNNDGSQFVGGVVNFGTRVSNRTAYQTLITHGLSSQAGALPKEKFVAYFDNVMNGGGKNGTFYYVPESGRQSGSIFNYDFGNDFLNSDVLNFNINADYTYAFANVGAVDNTRSSIDAGGQNVGGSLSVSKIQAFNTNVFNTPSGFDTSAFLTSSTLSKIFNFPHNASMEIIGQTSCNQLMDKIHVNVHVNGIPHPALTGDYIITDIEDNLSESGFTTTFQMFKDSDAVATTPFYAVSGDASKAKANENAMQNDYSK